MADYLVEIGENSSSSICDCCGVESLFGHGFVYKNSDAYAVYYASWSNSHPDKVVTLALALGEWGDNSTSDDRVCFGLDAFNGDTEFLLSIIDQNNSPWSKTELLGPMLTRQEALDHFLLDEVFSITERILEEHKSIEHYLLQNDH